MSGFLFTELLNAQGLVETLLCSTPPEHRQPLEESRAALNRAISLLQFPFDREDSTNAIINPVHNRRQNSTRRKNLPTLKKQVQALPGSSMDRPPEDGYTWRKYGNKEILNSSYPRCYYRCTFKHSHNCPATKHAQRFDEDPTIFNIVYKGVHVCGQRALSAPPAQRNNFIDNGTAPSLSSSLTTASLLGNEISLAEPYPVNSSSPFVSHFAPDESFHGSNQAGAWEHDLGDMLGGATSATSSFVDYGTFPEDGFYGCFFP